MNEEKLTTVYPIEGSVAMKPVLPQRCAVITLPKTVKRSRIPFSSILDDLRYGSAAGSCTKTLSTSDKAFGVFIGLVSFAAGVLAVVLPAL